MAGHWRDIVGSLKGDWSFSADHKKTLEVHWQVIGGSLQVFGRSLEGHWPAVNGSLEDHWTVIGRSRKDHWQVVGGSLTAVCLVSRALELKCECSRFSFFDTDRLLLLLHGRPM